MAARKKSLFELLPGQTVTYPSRSMSVTRNYPSLAAVRQEEDGAPAYFLFTFKKKYPEGFAFSVPATVPKPRLEESRVNDTDFLLDLFESSLDGRHRTALFQENIRNIKPGIRYKVKKHLRRKYRALPQTAYES